jgi:hypothetical protein
MNIDETTWTEKRDEQNACYMLVQESGSDDWLHELSVHMRHNMLKNRFVVRKASRGAFHIPGWNA